MSVSYGSGKRAREAGFTDEGKFAEELFGVRCLEERDEIQVWVFTADDGSDFDVLVLIKDTGCFHPWLGGAGSGGLLAWVDGDRGLGFNFCR